MIANEFYFLLFEFHSCAIPPIYIVVFREESEWIPNGHIFVDSLSIPRRNSTGKMRRYFIDFERRIHVEIMKSIQRGSHFQSHEISMRSPRGFFDAFSTSNRRNFCTRYYFHSVIFCSRNLF